MVGADAIFSGEGSGCPDVHCQAGSQGPSARERAGEAHAAAVVAVGLGGVALTTPLGTALIFPTI